MNSKVSIDTVVPVYCGAKYLPELVSELSLVKDRWRTSGSPLRLEHAIFVIDSALDESADVLNKLAGNHSWIKVITLSRNYGEHAATVAGIQHTNADWVITLDEDLQHKPADIDLLLKHQAATGDDIVYANPLSAVHGNSWRDTSSKTVKKLLSKLTGAKQIPLFNTFRLVRGEIARAAAATSASHTYFDIALSWFSTSTSAINIELLDSRFIDDKSSGYDLLKLIAHARRLIISSDLDIASMGLIIGVVSIVGAFTYALYAVLSKLFFPALVGDAGWTSLVVIITFFCGIMISLICIALQYIHILALKQLGKPTYFIIDRTSDSTLRHWFRDEAD